MTVPIGTTKTAPCGPTWRHRDGSIGPLQKPHRGERARSVVGPSQADMPFPVAGGGPTSRRHDGADSSRPNQALNDGRQSALTLAHSFTLPLASSAASR